MAYAGDTIRFQDGRFYWDKFTDQVVSGQDGAVVDQFPDHPVHGTFRIDGDRSLLKSDAGKSLDEWYLLDNGNRIYLLNAR